MSRRNRLLTSAVAMPQEEPALDTVEPQGGSEPAQSPLPIEPWAYRVNDAARVVGLGRSTLYELAAEGRLKMIKVAGRTLIPAESLRALLQEVA
jgi:excisionase family DNA binding protein